MLTLQRHRSRRRVSANGSAPRPAEAAFVVRLDDDAATRPDLVGAKAANLAVAAVAGLPVLDGIVLSERLSDAIAASTAAGLAGDARAALESAWASVAGHLPVVVRSSSRAEDGSQSSLAGQFTSVLNVSDYAGFLAAVDEVVRSAQLIALDAGVAHRAPMAVLVQPQLDAVAGGVMFGIDPVTGRSDRLVVAAVAGGPDRLVSGLESGSTHVLSRRGRLLSVDSADGQLKLRRGLRRQLSRLAERVGEVFGGPQDVEWAVDRNGTLWLLQSRPVTAAAAPPSKTSKRVLGPGPVAETFPNALSALEEDLWLRPLNDGLTEALVLAGLSTRRRLIATPPVVSLDGRAAVDLDILGASPLAPSFFARFDPIPPARRLRAAWRTGRLRAAMPALATDVIARADAELASVRPPATLPSRQLVAVLDGSYQALVSLNGYEILIGLLASGEVEGAQTAAGRALHVLAEARAAGIADAEIAASHPIVLSLVPPAVRPRTLLPDALPTSAPSRANRRQSSAHSPDDGPAPQLAELREDLRARIRWLQELTAVVAWELGTRLHASGALPAAGAVRWLGLEELRAAASGTVVLPELGSRRHTPTPPLPAAFRLASDGRVVPVATRQGSRDGGQGAGGGRAEGTVYGGAGVPPAGAVLVVRTLDPGLATVLPHLGGIVAETGSVLSHLAILAREFGVPTVVGVPGAVDRFPDGTKIVVDGTTGGVTVP